VRRRIGEDVVSSGEGTEAEESGRSGLTARSSMRPAPVDAKAGSVRGAADGSDDMIAIVMFEIDGVWRETWSAFMPSASSFPDTAYMVRTS
jgi:hypothetical protein